VGRSRGGRGAPPDLHRAEARDSMRPCTGLGEHRCRKRGAALGTPLPGVRAAGGPLALHWCQAQALKGHRGRRAPPGTVDARSEWHAPSSLPGRRRMRYGPGSHARSAALTGAPTVPGKGEDSRPAPISVRSSTASRRGRTSPPPCARSCPAWLPTLGRDAGWRVRAHADCARCARARASDRHPSMRSPPQSVPRAPPRHHTLGRVMAESSRSSAASCRRARRAGRRTRTPA
jgi:hypothetical protein